MNINYISFCMVLKYNNQKVIRLGVRLYRRRCYSDHFDTQSFEGLQFLSLRVIYHSRGKMEHLEKIISVSRVQNDWKALWVLITLIHIVMARSQPVMLRHYH